MKQDINLYQPRFRPQRIWLSARQLLALAGLLAVLLTVASVYLYRDRAEAELQAERLQQQRQSLQQDMNRLQKKLDALLADTRLQQRQQRLERQLQDYRQLVDFVSEQRFGGGEGFSAPLAALATLQVDTVWLEQILLSQRDIELRGAALKARAVPEYFEQLRRQQVFAGRDFELFRIRRSPEYDWKLVFTAATREKDHD